MDANVFHRYDEGTEKKRRNEKERKANRERPRCVVFDYVRPSNAVTFHKRQRPTARILASNSQLLFATRIVVKSDEIGALLLSA